MGVFVKKKTYTQYAIKFLGLKLNIDSFFFFFNCVPIVFVKYIKIEFKLRFRQACSIFPNSFHINGE